MTNRFRSVALALRPYVTGTYDLIAAADAIVALDSLDSPPVSSDALVVKSPDGHGTFNFTTRLWEFEHNYLVSKCLDNDVVLMYVRKNQKINAIKELRRVVPGAGLKACKEAVEDSLVGAKAQLLSDPWGPSKF